MTTNDSDEDNLVLIPVVGYSFGLHIGRHIRGNAQ
jgi:hypothetical protein